MYTVKSFVDKIAPFVMLESTLSHILPSVTLAQAIIESNKGNSGLTKKANNLFGIKGSYRGQSITLMTKEYIGGHYVDVPAKFRKYPDWWESTTIIAITAAIAATISAYGAIATSIAAA